MKKAPQAYSLSDFTDDGVLRMSPMLFLVIAFLSRHILFVIFAGISNFLAKRRGVDLGDVSVLFSPALLLIATLPALAVFGAFVRRVPNAGNLPRWIWQHGAWLLGLAAILDLGFLPALAFTGHIQFGELHIVTGLIDIYAIFFLARSPRVRDTFADFPRPDATPYDPKGAKVGLYHKRRAYESIQDELSAKNRPPV